MKTIVLPCILSLLLINSCNNRSKSHYEPELRAEVHAIGAMKDAMWKGELFPKIRLDTISPKDGLYGLGPRSYMRGELLLSDGRSYVSFIDEDSSLRVIETDTVSAPFFVYTYNTDWTSEALPPSVRDIPSLEQFINANFETHIPFVFKLSGRITSAKIHVQNLPEGTKVTSPKEAHAGQRSFELHHEPVEIIGFFSNQHHGIFTHHDTNLHMHLITSDKSRMGHLDELYINGMTLSVPKSISPPN